MSYHIEEFKAWLKSDNVIKTKEGYRCQCNQWQQLFTLNELKAYFRKEYWKQFHMFSI